MLARILSTLGLWAIATFAIVYGKHYGFATIIALLAMAVNYEICTLLRSAKFKPVLWYIQLSTVVIFLFNVNICPRFPVQFFLGDWIFIATIIPLIISIVKSPYDDYFKKAVLPSIAVIFVVPFMLKFFAQISSVELHNKEYHSIMFAVWVIAAAKFSDVGAYVIGCAFGRHKMAPTISPNKSWEGAIGGVLSSAIIGAAFAWLGGVYGVFYTEITPTTAALLSIPIGIVAILSDLLESVFKRRMNVKDSGTIIPGIGGALDLADSLILTAPIAYLIFFIFQLLIFKK